MDESVNKTGEGAAASSALEALLDDAETRLNTVYLKTYDVNMLMNRLGLGRDYMFVGSVALLAAGLPLQRDPHDVDIVVHCTRKQDNLLRALEDAAVVGGEVRATGYPPVEGEKRWYAGFYRFTVGGTTVNAWTVRTALPKTQLRLWDLPFATVAYVLRYKLAYRREKDVRDMVVVANTLLNLVSHG